MSDRKHISKRYKVEPVAGTLVTFIVVDDLDDGEILQHLEYALAGEDFEYCQVLASEAAFRNIRIDESIRKFLNA